MTGLPSPEDLGIPTTTAYQAVSSPNAPRPSDPLVRSVADALARTEKNYDREGSGPGSRFEGRLLEDVQAELAVRMVREAEVSCFADVLRSIRRALVRDVHDRAVIIRASRIVNDALGLSGDGDPS